MNTGRIGALQGLMIMLKKLSKYDKQRIFGQQSNMNLIKSYLRFFLTLFRAGLLLTDSRMSLVYAIFTAADLDTAFTVSLHNLYCTDNLRMRGIIQRSRQFLSPSRRNTLLHRNLRMHSFRSIALRSLRRYSSLPLSLIRPS